MDKVMNLNSLLESIKNVHQEDGAQFQEFIPGVTPIPPSGKYIDHREKQLMVEAAMDGWLTTGRHNDLFEKYLNEPFDIEEVQGSFDEAKVLKLNISRSEDKINWEPLLDIEDAVKLTVEFFLLTA